MIAKFNRSDVFAQDDLKLSTWIEEGGDPDVPTNLPPLNYIPLHLRPGRPNSLYGADVWPAEEIIFGARLSFWLDKDDIQKLRSDFDVLDLSDGRFHTSVYTKGQPLDVIRARQSRFKELLALNTLEENRRQMQLERTLDRLVFLGEGHARVAGARFYPGFVRVFDFINYSETDMSQAEFIDWRAEQEFLGPV